MDLRITAKFGTSLIEPEMFSDSEISKGNYSVLSLTRADKELFS